MRSFLTAHQHIIGYSVTEMVDMWNQGQEKKTGRWEEMGCVGSGEQEGRKGEGNEMERRG